MDRTSPIVITVSAMVLLVTAALIALRLTTGSWQSLGTMLVRIIRPEEDHPHFELLMQ